MKKIDVPDGGCQKWCPKDPKAADTKKIFLEGNILKVIESSQ